MCRGKYFMNGPTCVKCTPVLPSMWDIFYIISDDSPMVTHPYFNFIHQMKSVTYLCLADWHRQMRRKRRGRQLSHPWLYQCTYHLKVIQKVDNQHDISRKYPLITWQDQQTISEIEIFLFEVFFLVKCTSNVPNTQWLIILISANTLRYLYSTTG